MKALAFAGAALLALGACTSPAPITGDAIKTSLAQTDLGTTPLLLAEMPRLGVAATLQPSDVANSIVTWRTGDDVTLSFDSGFLVASRGLPDDLMTSDVSSVAKGFFTNRRQGAVYARVNEYIGGEDQIVKVVFQCTQTVRTSETIKTFSSNRAVTRVSEECRSTTRDIENTYWIGADGTFWKSVQWVSPLVGYVETERLIR